VLYSPQEYNLEISLLWGTLSKDFSKSLYIVSTWPPLSKHSVQLSNIQSNCSIVDIAICKFCTKKTSYPLQRTLWQSASHTRGSARTLSTSPIIRLIHKSPNSAPIVRHLPLPATCVPLKCRLQIFSSRTKPDVTFLLDNTNFL